MNIDRALSLVAAALALSLAGCASPDTAKGAAKEGVQIQKAVEAPLADLNLVQEKIPAVLEAAVKAPYALPAERGCPRPRQRGEHARWRAGRRPWTPRPPPPTPAWVARGTNMVGDAANDALRGGPPRA